MNKDIKKMKKKFQAGLIGVFTLLTGLVVFFSVYNVKNAAGTVFLISNFVILFVIYILLMILVTYYSFAIYEKKLSNFVDTDRLTNGINYEKFLVEAQTLLDTQPNKSYAVFYADIQNFKYINDTFGYDVGDNILMFISQKIKEVLGDKGYFARISADNYTAIFPYDDKNEFVEPIYSIIDDVCWFESIQKANYKPEIYVGIFCSGEADTKLNISEMIDRANMAQKSIKGSSEYHIAFYNEEIRERLIAEKELERRMDTALANEEFKVYYQPKYQVDSGEIVGAEALVRWDSPDSGFMSPAKFIPLFEQNGFIINLDQYVFECVCKNMRAWLDSGVKVVPVSINVSRLQFYRLDFVKRYTKIKEKYDIPDGLLELEFTESIVFENLEILRKIVMSLKKVGFSCSIDDFGSGYSSLNILKNLPMDTLKLDKLFFKDSENLERDKALISSVITMSRALNMQTVAEGIENWVQVAFLREIGCDIIQGFVYSEPIPLARYTMLLEGNRKKQMPVDLRTKRVIKDIDETDILNDKYRALISLLEGKLIEVDFNSNTFEFINSEANEEFMEWEKTSKGIGFDEMFSTILEKYVHPDDIASVKARCSSISVMSAFYQNETKIITEMRVFNKTTKSYEWSKNVILRINTRQEDNDFRAFLYSEPIRDNLPTDSHTFIGESVEGALKNVCTFIYEFELTNGTFKKLYCNTAKVGDQPESGDIAWLHECYVPKIIAKEDVDRIRKFCDPKKVEHEFESGRTQLVTTARATFNKTPMVIKITISKMPVHDSDQEYKYVLLCHVEDQSKQIDQAYDALEATINNSVTNFCDMIFYVNGYKDTFVTYQTKPPYLKIPDKQKYSTAIDHFINNLVHPDDREKASSFLSVDTIKHRIATDEKGDSLKLRCLGKDKEYHTITIISMCSMSDDTPFATFFVQGKE